MARPNVTLQPSKRIITLAATEIYAAYLTQGCITGEDHVPEWIERSVREAVAIANQVQATTHSDEELPDNGKQRLREWTDDDGVPPMAPPT